MTPEEKAKELVDKFIPEEESIEFSHVKQCALICVDEIIEALEHNSWQNKDWVNFYDEVKQEIEKL
jgi:hypothetical protein